jgi:hypothetical protein
LNVSTDDETFLARWSRQKRQARAEAPQPPAIGSGALQVEPDTGQPSDEADIEAVIAALPRIEDLTPGSSIAAFLQKGIPIALQQAAMRRMWTLDPQIRDFIEVAENQYDWNIPGGCPGFAPLDGTPGHDAVIKSALRMTEVAFDPTEVTDKNVAPHTEPARLSQLVENDQVTMTVPSEGIDTERGDDDSETDVDQSVSSQPKRRHGGALPG